MTSDIRLADLCDAIVDCPHSTPVWTDSGAVVLRSQNIRGGRLDLSQTSYTDEAHFAERTRRAVPVQGDLVITREAPMGEVCMIPANLRCCLGQRMVLLRPNCKRADPRYLLYALQSKKVQQEIGVNEGTGSTVSNLRIPLLEALPIPTRSLPEQRAIAHILGTLDDKIELNRRMNETLEALARALFKSWFVDFDPVRAKAEGRDPGLPPPLADLFPDSFVDSELGEIPKGWGVRSVGDAVSLSRDALDPGDYATETFDHFSIPAFDSGRVPACDSGDSIKSQKFVVVDGCVLVSKLNPATPRVWMAPSASTRRQVASTEFLVCVGNKTKVMSRELIYCLASSAPFIEYLTAHATGTSNSHQRVRTQDFLEYQWARPQTLLCETFTKLVNPLFARIGNIRNQSDSLAALRDTLLPKLISGELRVKDAETMVAAS